MQNTCSLCGKPYDHPALQFERAFAESIGAETGETCDDCTKVLLSGSPEEIDDLLGRAACPYCGGYNCDCEDQRR